LPLLVTEQIEKLLMLGHQKLVKIKIIIRLINIYLKKTQIFLILVKILY